MPRALIRQRLTIPPLPERLLAREHLEERIAAEIESQRLVIVSATAGAGKTTTIVRALDRVDRPVAWLTLDEADRAPGRLLTYIEAALRSPEGRLADLLAEGVSHEDAAAILVEELGERPAVLVLDEVDRVQASRPAWAIIEAVVGYSPPSATVVLVSRRPLLLATLPPAAERVGWILEQDLALDESEVEQVLALGGDSDLTAGEIMARTSGWVTGVLFDAWRSEHPASRLGGATDPLHGFLATQILEQLPSADQRFLIGTSLLDELTEQRALALGIADAGERMASLRRGHLPGTWTADGGSFRCHSRFREFLLSRLPARGSDEVAGLYRRHGQLLLREGHPEEAVEALLTAGSLAEAAEAAALVMPAVLERLDLALADRWLRAFRSLEHPPTGVVVAEVTLAAGREEFSRVVEIADRLDERGEIDELLAASGRAAALIAWAFAHVGRIDAAERIVDGTQTGPDAPALRYMLQLIRPRPDADAPVPSLAGGALDALVIRDHYIYGRLERVLAETHRGWIGAVTTPWRIAALRASGRIADAAELFEAARESGLASLGLLGVVGPDVLLDAGDPDAAWTMTEEGLALTRAKGSLLFLALNRCVAAKIALRARNDPALALTILDELADHQVASYRTVGESLRTWRGLARLRLGRDVEALADLDEAVASMTAGDRILDLPTAAVFLAEARWRAVDEHGADAAIELALDAAGRQGSQHLLLQALRDFPAVLARRLDAEADADSPWHAVGRALRNELADGGDVTLGRVRLRDLGKPTLVVDGEVVRARISKAVELLAYLVEHPRHEAPRDQLMDALFDGRSDASARSYLRQAIHWLRQALPDGQLADVPGGGVRLENAGTIVRDSAEALQRFREADRLQGLAAVAAIGDGLALLESGEYLAGSSGTWTQVRRDELRVAADGARLVAAELAYAHGDYGQAQALVEKILVADPYMESVWRLRMRVCAALGDEQGVIEAFRRCRDALQELGADVAPATASLLTALRR
jgi:DNA-binding SARP family transcriptional activator